MRWTAVILAAVLLLVAACGDGGPKSRAPGGAAQERALEGAPAPLAALHRQANELLGGGADGFRKRLSELKGYPVVVNKWASWCPPCRSEFPFFQRQALERGKEVAFLGVNSTDDPEDAKRFLRAFPVSYPSYEDPDLAIASVFEGQLAFPTTAFYDSSGELAYVRQGAYPDEADLAEDIERYAQG